MTAADARCPVEQRRTHDGGVMAGQIFSNQTAGSADERLGFTDDVVLIALHPDSKWIEPATIEIHPFGESPIATSASHDAGKRSVEVSATFTAVVVRRAAAFAALAPRNAG